MGGFGSGRGKVGKRTTSEMWALDVRRLHRQGLLSPSQSYVWKWSRDGEEFSSVRISIETDRLILNYRSRSSAGEWQLMEHAVALQWTPCHLGGRRVWFQCPTNGCRRRVAILFGGSIFACRHCHELAYQCQREAQDDRSMRRADKIRQRLGWALGIGNPEGGKPRGMHWRTFKRLKAAHNAFSNASWVGTLEKLERVNRRLMSLGLDPIDNVYQDF